MVRGGDDNRVEVGTRDQVAVVRDLRGSRSGDLSGVLQVVGTDVADGGDLLVGVLFRGAQQRSAAVSHSDEAEPNSVVCAQDALVGKCCDCGGLGETASGGHGLRAHCGVSRTRAPDEGCERHRSGPGILGGLQVLRVREERTAPIGSASRPGKGREPNRHVAQAKRPSIYSREGGPDWPVRRSPR